MSTPDPRSRRLDRISIASPCTADWDEMSGDAKTRFCAECKLHVHDLSAMSAGEAEQTLRRAGAGRLCVRFFRRADGTVLTQDCPVGLHQRLRRAKARAVALTIALLASLLGCGRRPAGPREPPVMGETCAPPASRPTVEMGDAALPLMGKVRKQPAR